MRGFGSRNGDFGERAQGGSKRSVWRGHARPPPLHHTPQRSEAGARGSSAPPAALLVACQPMRQTALPRCEARSAKPPEPPGSGCHTPRAAVAQELRSPAGASGGRASCQQGGAGCAEGEDGGMKPGVAFDLRGSRVARAVLPSRALGGRCERRYVLLTRKGCGIGHRGVTVGRLLASGRRARASFAPERDGPCLGAVPNP